MRNVAALAMVVLLVLIPGACRKAEQGRATGARVDYVSGDVKIDGVVVEPGATIKPVFTVTTGTGSSTICSTCLSSNRAGSP